jgi:hypothetical protein
MTSTYTPSLRINEMGNGDQDGTWGTTTNTNWNLMEQAVAGVQSISLSNANYTLSDLNGASDESRNMVIVVGGSQSSSHQVIAPLVEKVYVVVNNTSGGYPITFGGATGFVVTIPNGYSTLVYCNGTNFYAGITAISSNLGVLGNLDVAGSTLLESTLDVNGDTVLLGDLTVAGATNIVPVGTVVAYASTSPPSGFLLCNGQAVSRGTYASLFALVGTTFGAGDFTTTFNLPFLPNLLTSVVYIIKY